MTTIEDIRKRFNDRLINTWYRDAYMYWGTINKAVRDYMNILGAELLYFNLSKDVFDLIFIYNGEKVTWKWACYRTTGGPRTYKVENCYKLYWIDRAPLSN